MNLTISQADWYAYQLDRPDLRRGCAFFFRRPENPDSTADVQLHGIDPQAKYLVSITGETYDRAVPKEMIGQELIRTRVEIESRPGSALLRYERRRPVPSDSDD